ncbi:phosphatase [Actinomadura craniellae]|uniref:Phosphatase n=2 Tax=Actinomadura craniellae TaxID=2231787 RepID=A0A365H8A9_9ACTN|nr:phosphatase [Actinomadura craniellae]
MIAGEVATPRQNNLLHYRRMAAGNPYYLFGLDLKRQWSEADVLAMMAERCGVSPDPRHVYGDDTIDPDRTLDALEAMAERIRHAADSRARVVLATGHPQALPPIYQALGRALRARGCRLLTPAEGWWYEAELAYGTEVRRLRYVEDVAMLQSEDGRMQHTHDPQPMEAILAELAAESDDWPDLAIADHGWAGAAGEAGIVTVGFADCNDPALFAGEAEGKVAAVVPLDDGVPAHQYAPLTAYLLELSGLSA